jgi:cytoskeleton protein RodZ
MGFGEILKETRINKQITLEQIEEDTKIRRLYLEAIENEKFAVLPPRVYAIGFVKKYAKYLGLDENKIAEEFKEKAYGEENQEVAEPAIPATGRQLNIPLKNIAAGILFFIVVVWAGNFLIGVFSEMSQRDLNPQQGGNIGLQEPKETESPSIASPPEEEELAKVVLELKANSDCWLQAIVDGENVYEAILRTGEEKTLEGKESVYIKLGNACGVEIAYNGEIIEPLGQPGEVVDKEFLPDKRLE